jgi:hypothetical protein
VTKRIVFPREVLLVELERWCRDPACGARARMSLTKEEARAYTGFECGRCGRRNEDALAERDIPEWWEELRVTSLDGLRPARDASVGAGGGGEAEVVARMSEAWRHMGRGGGSDEFGDAEGGEGDSF